MPNKIEMQEAIREHLAGNGWTKDSWGHMKKEKEGKNYRMCIRSNVIREEVLVERTKQWIRIRSHPIRETYKNLKKKEV